MSRPAIDAYKVNDWVMVHSFGNWYRGHVVKLGRTRVHVTYQTGTGAEYTKACTLDLVRPDTDGRALVHVETVRGRNGSYDRFACKTGRSVLAIHRTEEQAEAELARRVEAGEWVAL